MLRIKVCRTYAEEIREACAVVKSFGTDPDKKMYAFCEDKLTMSLETEIARALGGGTFNVTVSSFSRFIHGSERGGKVLDKEGSVMAVKSILIGCKDELGCFKRSALSPNTPLALYELIAQLKSAKITPGDIKDELAVDAALGGKMRDIAVIFEKYENYIAERGLYDSNSYLALMPEIAERSKGASAMLVGFPSLTRQGVDIVASLAKSMDEVTVFVLGGDNGELYTNELKTQLTREIGDFCIEDSSEIYDPERKKIMGGLFDPTAFTGGREETERIFMYEATDVGDELKHIATIIRREVLGGMRYRDMAVAVGNPSAYSETVSSVFSDYGIPFFIDERKKLSDHPLAKLAVAYVEYLRRRGTEEIFALEKNPYFSPDKKVADKFISFYTRNALTPKSVKSGLNRTLSGENVDEEREIFERERERLNGCFVSPATVGEFAEAIKNLFALLNAEELAANNAARLKELGCASEAAFTEQAYRKTVEVIDSLSDVIGGEKMTAGDFRGILLAGLTATEISVIPQLLDAVYIGDYKECRYLEHRILFAAGLSGEIPFTRSDTAILTDRDLSRLERYDLFIEPKIRIVNKRERENVGAALLSFKDKLYLSRPALTADGKPAPKGRVIEFFSAMFSRNGAPLSAETDVGLRLKAKEDPAFGKALAALEYSAKRPALAEFLSGAGEFRDGIKDDFSIESSFYEAASNADTGTKKTADELLAAADTAIPKELKEAGALTMRGDAISATVLESYFFCPYACFIQHALGAAEKEEGEIKTNEFGSFFHSALEAAVKRIIESGLPEDSETDGIVDEISSELLNDARYSKYSDKEKFRAAFSLAVRELKRVYGEIVKGYRRSGYRPTETEAAFRDGAKHKPIPLDTPLGRKKLVGKIDRIDRCGDLVRIVDYKTGEIHGSDEEFYVGLSLQLYLYMNALISGDAQSGAQMGEQTDEQTNEKLKPGGGLSPNKGLRPGGAYYFPVNDDFTTEGGYVYGFKGKTLAEERSILAADSSLTEGGKSDILGYVFRRTEEGVVPSRKNSSVIDEKTFDDYLRYAIEIAKKGAEEISEGVIVPSPYQGKCKICRYKLACPFDKAEGRERKVTGVCAESFAEEKEDEYADN